ncbi:MAG: prepilin-type N-terminal cleavage/methylation domain-containing protein [Pseudomonadota bacterium]
MRPMQRGFTLVEVMIAIALMAVLAVMSWRGLDSVSRANDQLEDRTERVARLLRALDQFERDVALRATIELPVPASANPSAAMPLLPVAMQARQPNGAPFVIEIVRTAPAAPGQWQRVQWWVRGDVLYRAAGPVSAVFPLQAPEPADRVAVLDGVATFQLRAWEPGLGWRRLPGVAPARAPATGVELLLAVSAGNDAAARSFRRVLAF